jgi:hypothetical protein
MLCAHAKSSPVTGKPATARSLIGREALREGTAEPLMVRRVGRQGRPHERFVHPVGEGNRLLGIADDHGSGHRVLGGLRNTTHARSGTPPEPD